MIKLTELKNQYLDDKLSYSDYYDILAKAIGVSKIKELIEANNLTEESELKDWNYLYTPMYSLYKKAIQENKIDPENELFPIYKSVHLTKHVYQNYCI